MAGRPAGAQNKDKPFRDALRMEIAEAGEDRKRLRSVARALLDKAESGDVAAIAQVADRLDGKPAQSHEHGGSDGGDIVVRQIVRTIIDPQHSDGEGIPPTS